MLPEQAARDGVAATPRQAAKVARHHGGTTVDPDTVDRTANDEDERVVRAYMRRYMPLADGRRADSKVCMYTNTPDEDFVLGFDPSDDRVLICSPCSGHGFKFSDVIGRICAELVLEGTTDFDLDFISPSRFANQPN
jgi:sarcosine oxidase